MVEVSPEVLQMIFFNHSRFISLKEKIILKDKFDENHFILFSIFFIKFLLIVHLI